VKDVTQFKLIQSERENLLTEAREANQDKEHFMEAVTHELRTPLNAIMGYLGLLNDGIHENLNDQQQYWLERAIDNTDKLNGYLTQVVFFFQLLSGKVRIELYDFSLHFQPLREKFEHEAEEKGIELIFLSNPSLPLHANHEEVTQILHRLIDNALRFTPAGGRIIVASECIGDRAIISVTDTGCGIPADQMERIFKRYAQIYSPFQHHNPGFGLGLAFSKIYAARMNGTLAVESEVGKGSTFTLTIPCNPHSE
jgi:signal transduction histidine kinase